MLSRAPRFEALLVGLTLLAAAGVALAAAYMPSGAPRQPVAVVEKPASEAPRLAMPAISLPRLPDDRRIPAVAPVAGLVGLFSGAMLVLLWVYQRRRAVGLSQFLPARRRAISERLLKWLFAARHMSAHTIKWVRYRFPSGRVAEYRHPRGQILAALRIGWRAAQSEYPRVTRLFIRWRESAVAYLRRLGRGNYAPAGADGHVTALPQPPIPTATAGGSCPVEAWRAASVPLTAEPAQTCDGGDIHAEHAAAWVALVADACERYGMARSSLLLAEGGKFHQSSWARLTIDPHPDETPLLEGIPEQLRQGGIGDRVWWRRGAHRPLALSVEARRSVRVPWRGRMLMPIARRAQGLRRRAAGFVFLPLQTWRRAGFYGGAALDAFHAALTGLLYTESPESLALTIIDQGRVSSLYAGVPHIVHPPGHVSEWPALFGRALRRMRAQRGEIRPLILAMIEPEVALLDSFTEVFNRMARHADLPIYIVLAQTRPLEAGRAWYASMPAIITASETAPPTWLPGGVWAQPGSVRIIAREIREAGIAHVYDAAQVAPLIEPLRHWRGGALPPTFWDMS